MVLRICVYIDGANFFGCMNNINKRYIDERFDFEKYVNSLIGNKKLVKVYYYNGYSKRKINPSVWERQNKLFSRLKKLKD